MKSTVIYKGTKKIDGEIVTENDVEIPVTEEIKDDLDLYIGQERKELGQAGLKKVKTIQKTKKGQPVGDPIVTEQIIKSMKPTVIYKGTKKLPLQNQQYSLSLIKNPLVYKEDLQDKEKTILDNVSISDESVKVKKEVIGEIPRTVGKHDVTVRVTYKDGSHKDVNVPVKIKAKEDDEDISTDDNSKDTWQDNGTNGSANSQDSLTSATVSGTISSQETLKDKITNSQGTNSTNGIVCSETVSNNYENAAYNLENGQQAASNEEVSNSEHDEKSQEKTENIVDTNNSDKNTPENKGNNIKAEEKAEIIEGKKESSMMSVYLIGTVSAASVLTAAGFRIRKRRRKK